MTPEQKAAYVIGIATMVFARTAGMQAENNQRVMNGHAPAYGESAFEKLIQDTGCHHNGILTIFQE